MKSLILLSLLLIAANQLGQSYKVGPNDTSLLLLLPTNALLHDVNLCNSLLTNAPPLLIVQIGSYRGKVSRALRMSTDAGAAPKTTPETARQIAQPGKSWLRCRAIGVGACAGQGVMPNDAFASLVDTNDAWIGKRTGIRRRHILSAGVGLREIAVTSAKESLINANVSPLDIDLVIVATSSPDDLFGDAASIASAIGASNAAAFDLTAACSGFLYSIVTASQFMHSGAYKKVLVIGADALTRFLDWSDRGTCILFGDGAGAMVLEATDSVEESGLLGFALHSDGGRYSNLKLAFESKPTELKNEEKNVVDTGSYGKLTMNGAEVYKFAVNEVPNTSLVTQCLS